MQNISEIFLENILHHWYSMR